MRKINLIITMTALALLLCACEQSDYKKAVSAMEAAEYARAYEIFQAIPEYKDSQELATECVYQMAAEAMGREDYETARSLFAEISEYMDSAQKAEACSIQMGYQAANAMKEEIACAVAQKDEDRLCGLVLAYLTMEHSHEEISAHMNDYVMDTIRTQFETVDYDNYLFLDRLIALSRDNELLMSNLGDRLAAFDTANDSQRTIAFLTGTWIRMDSSQVTGLRIRVYYTEENTLAMVLEDFSYVSSKNKKAKFHWDKGMPIWNDIRITDSTHITMDIMRLTCYYNLGVQSNRFEAGVGYLDYDGMRILTQITEEEDALWRENFDTNIYIKESAIKEVPELTGEDFVISFGEENELFGAKNADLNAWFSAENTLFCAYNDRNPLTTARGISVGSDWMSVVEQYGYGRGNLYVEADDAIHARLRESYRKDEESGERLCDILSGQADEYMEYTLNDTNRMLRFYFKDGKVSWICFYTA